MVLCGQAVSVDLLIKPQTALFFLLCFLPCCSSIAAVHDSNIKLCAHSYTAYRNSQEVCTYLRIRIPSNTHLSPCFLLCFMSSVTACDVTQCCKQNFTLHTETAEKCAQLCSCTVKTVSPLRALLAALHLQGCCT